MLFDNMTTFLRNQLITGSKLIVDEGKTKYYKAFYQKKNTLFVGALLTHNFYFIFF